MALAMNKTFMYHLTLQPPSSIINAILGQFAGTREQQILAASGSHLTLYRLDPQQRKVTVLLSHDCFGIIRGISAFRLAGSSKDFIVIASDSGRISIIEYHSDKNVFKQVHLETFGKSGIRRVIPGQYLAVDPKGRAAMIASVEKNKLVYVLNRNAQAELTISSPLEAHKPQTLVFAVTALDVGYENPVFACLEVDYGESDQDPTGQAYEDIEKQLVFYELDLGLNHVVRKWTDTVDRSANRLFHVPGGTDGPSGVLVCAEGTVTYRHMNQEPQRVPIPRRRGPTEDPERKRHIVAGVVHRMKGGFFFLLQSEDGDLFKATIDMVEDDEGRSTGEVRRLRLIYFDTVPVAQSLLVFKSGHLFVASESGDHHFYQFASLGDDDEEKGVRSDNYSNDLTEELVPAYFHPHVAENLARSELINSLSPLIGCKVANLTEDDAPQIYTISGTGARSTLRCLKHGIEVSEMAANDLQNDPLAVWAIKKRVSDESDSYIIITFHAETIVLGIGEQVEEVTDSGFISSCHTLAVQQLGENSMLQVHPRGLRHIFEDGRRNEWPVPQHRTVVAASTNERQVALALSSGELVYFELEADGNLAEYDERKEMSGTVTALSLGPVPEGRQRSRFLAVGTDDSTVRILSVEPDSTFENMSLQALSAPATGLCIMSMNDASGGTSLQLHVGLHSGVYLRATLDEVTGDLSGAQPRFLGPKPVKVFPIFVEDQPSVLALSSRAWVGYTDLQTKTNMMTPLDYPTLEWGGQFNSAQIVQGVVGVAGRTLKIFTVEKISTNLLSESIPLAHTPKSFVKHPEYPIFCVIESDNNMLSAGTRRQLQDDTTMVNGDAEVAKLPPEDFGYPRGKGHWASCIQLIDPVDEKKAVYTLDLEENEAALSVATVAFSSQDNETFLVVGTAKDLVVSPRSHSAAYIHIYRFHDSGKSLEFIHKTKVSEPPLAVLEFHGRLLAGVGAELFVYDLGVKQLLRKSRAKVVTNLITGLQTQGSRIIVSDIRDGAVFVVYKYGDNRLVPFADDTVARWTTCTAMADYETAAGGDKFGNLWLVRCPPKVSEGADEESTGGHLIHERNYLQGTPNRLDLVAHFFSQDIPTSLQRVSLFPGAKDVVMWSGLQGTIGILVPFADKGDADMFQTLEAHMRSEDPPIAGRDHLIYRSYYAPVKAVVDGDLIERFMRLPVDKKASIAADMEKDVLDLESKIMRLRVSVAF